jgi:hypothetical protein
VRGPSGAATPVTRSRFLVLFSGAAFLALHAAFTFLVPMDLVSGVRFWGANALRYATPGAAAFAYAAAAAAIATVAWIGRPRAAGAFVRAPSGAGPFRARVLLPGLLLLSLLLFVLLRSRYALLGDNMLRVREAELGTSPRDEIGVMLLYHGLVLLGRRASLGAREIFAGVSFASGLLYAAVSWALARRIGSRSASGWIFAGLLSAGCVELFFGYFEVYPPVLACLLVTVWAAVRAAEGETPAYWPILFLAIAVALHRVSVLWAPAALAPLWIRRFPGLSGSTARRFTLGLLAAGAAAGLLASGRSSVLLPVLPRSGRGYALLTLPHLSDYLNAQFLGSAAGFLLAPIALVRWLGAKRSAPVAWILLLSWLPPAVGLFFFRPLLGGADWDVLSLAAPFAFLFAARALSGETPTESPQPFLWLAPAVILSAFNTLPWLAVQAGDASIVRARELIRSDRADYFTDHPAPLHLAFVFGANGLPELQREELQRGERELPDDPRFPYNLAVLARARGDWPEAEAQALAAFRVRRDYLPPLDVLYDAYKARGATQDQALVGRAILEAHEHDRGGVERYLTPQRIDQIRRETALLPEP